MRTNRALFALAPFLVASFGCGAQTADHPGGGTPDGQAPADGSSIDATSLDAGEGSDGSRENDGSDINDGGPADSGKSDAGCLTGMVDFVLRAAAGSPVRYCLGPGGQCSTGEDWLTILTADGGASFPQSATCETDCTSCAPRVCPPLACALPSVLGDAGAQWSWEGAYFQSSVCGATSEACTSSACAPSGHYIAHMCGWAAQPDASFIGGSCSGAGTIATCVDVPFAWPPAADAGPVAATIGAPPADAGSD